MMFPLPRRHSDATPLVSRPNDAPQHINRQKLPPALQHKKDKRRRLYIQQMDSCCCSATGDSFLSI
jgi:hypothetical protein